MASSKPVLRVGVKLPMDVAGTQRAGVALVTVCKRFGGVVTMLDFGTRKIGVGVLSAPRNKILNGEYFDYLLPYLWGRTLGETF